MLAWKVFAEPIHNYMFYCILCGQIKEFNSSITTIFLKLVVIELWLGSYRMLEYVDLEHCMIIDTFYKRKLFIYSMNVLRRLKNCILITL